MTNKNDKDKGITSSNTATSLTATPKEENQSTETTKEAANKAPGGVSRIRRSSRQRRDDHDPIIAPGFGTAKDIRRLAAQLSEGSGIVLPPEAVEAMMKSRGQGTRRSSRGQTNEEEPAPAVATSTWSDFIKEEGVAATAESKSNDDRKRSADPPIKAEGKKAKGATKGAAAAAVATEEVEDLREQHSGVLCQTGTLDTAVVGRKSVAFNNPPVYNLIEPTRLLPTKIKIRSVHTSGNSCHSIAISNTGTVYGWGRNEMNQLSPSLPADVALPTVLIDLPRQSKFISAATGKSHTLFLDEDGAVYSIGYNKSGQCAAKLNAEFISTYKRCVFQFGGEAVSDISIKQVSCGEDFSVAVSVDGHLYSAGSSEFGQLGNGETGEHIVTAGKTGFANSNVFVRRTTFCHAPNEKLYTSGGSTKEKVEPLPDSDSVLIDKVACGKHHTIAIELVDASALDDDNAPRIFSWGCGAYGVLGHGVQVDEYFPRVIGSLTSVLKTTRGTPKSTLSVSAGAGCSLLQLPNGHVYYWGKHRPVGEATMRPTLIDALANNAHVVRHCGSGMQTVVVSTANAVTVAWGQGPHGELGFGASGNKSSAKPNFVSTLDGCRVAGLACGYAHTLFIIRNDDSEDQAAVKKLPELNHDDCQPLIEAAASKPKNADAKPSKK